MNHDLGDKTVLVYDFGLFTHWAECLPRWFGKVLYYTPWKSAFSKSRHLYIGDGLPDVDRIENLWDHIDDVDLFVFPDIQDGDLQTYLRSIGKRVWGSGVSERLEMDRWYSKKVMKQLGMNVQPCRRIIGLQNLCDHLKDNDGKELFVKISTTRGDAESFGHKRFSITEETIDEMKQILGPLAMDSEFIVEDKIDSKIEVGYDGYCIDGEFPDPSWFGYEIKDSGYIGTIQSYSDLPESVRETNELLKPILRDKRYRGWFSTEVRVTEKGDPYLIDFTCRSGSPPSQVMQEMASNWGEILWEGADGNLINPEPVAQYGAMAMVFSERCDKHWQTYHCPKFARKFLKRSFACDMDEIMHTIPQDVGMASMASIVQVDDDLMMAIKKLKVLSESVEGRGIDIKMDAVLDAVKQIHTGTNDFGYKFGTGDIPTVEEVAGAL